MESEILSDYQLDVLLEKSMAEFVRPCLVSSGYGDTFSGIKCTKSTDCQFYNSSCDYKNGVCRTPSTQELREKYFQCFYDNMPPIVEDYIRTKVLDPLDSEFPKESKYFKRAVRDAATKFDCLSYDPFDIQFSERYSANSALYCQGQGLGFINLDVIEENEDFINEMCPEFLCLGERSCRFDIAKMCKTPYATNDICYSFVEVEGVGCLL